MTFTNSEYRFLAQEHGRRGWASIGHDCPPKILQGILERRAKMLGPEFTAFQEEQRRLASPNAPLAADDLDARVAGSKLF
jgi:hypothetical protein